MGANSSKGSRRVGIVMDSLALLGYSCVRTSASGQVRAKRTGFMPEGDILAMPIPIEHVGASHLIPSVRVPLQLEVGGPGKRLVTAFTKMRQASWPGFEPVVVIFANRQRKVYLENGGRFGDLRDAIKELAMRRELA